MKILRVGSSAAEYRALIERYKVQNPVKFAKKEKVLMANLAQLKAQESKDEEDKPEVKAEKPKRK